MREKLIQLGFTEKEATVYLALLEYGTQPASVIAKKVQLPRPTVLFLFDNLIKKGFVRKSRKGRTQYFYVDPLDLKQAKLQQHKTEEKLLDETMPLLMEFKNPFSSPPKITFFEGLDGCRKAYSTLLTSKTSIYEFAAHDDLIKMGETFMKNFVEERSRRKIFIYSICRDTPLHRFFRKLDKAQLRKLKIFPTAKGGLYSSIAVFDDNVLLLNLYHDAFAILIQNKEVADTLKTIHGLVFKD